MKVIETEDLAFRYGRRAAIHDLRINVERADIYGFLGPNGAGKTTSIRLLLGLLRPTRGRISFFGDDLRRDRIAVLTRVGVHLEGHAFYPYLSGRRNLQVFGRYHGVRDDQRIRALLEIVGLSGAADDKVRTYSLGMKQRLGIAQALVARPELLILDEPLNGLDPPGVIEVRELLQRLNKEDGLTIFFSSHRLDEAQKICSRIGLIDGGRLVCQGPIGDLLAPPGAGLLRIRTSDNTKARDVLGGATRVRMGEDAEGRLEVAGDAADAPQLARLLVAAGLDLYELAPEAPSLEDLFRREVGAAGRRDEGGAA